MFTFQQRPPYTNVPMYNYSPCCLWPMHALTRPLSSPPRGPTILQGGLDRNCTNWDTWSRALQSPDPESTSCQLPEVRGVMQQVESLTVTTVFCGGVMIMECVLGHMSVT